jgi:dTDP-glucose 4,6-dehydratase
MLKKKILVSGGAGFIGANFVLKQIAETQNEILNFDKLTYAGNLNTLVSIENNERYTFVQGDITDESKVWGTISKFKPDAIVNFAAESHVDRSIDGPMEFLNTNIMGTAILLEACRKYLDENSNLRDTFRLLHVSTDEVYGSLGDEGFFTEQTSYDPSSPYSASKASSDHLVRAWQRTFDIPSLITNCSNNYGQYQFPEKLIPLMILNCLSEKSLPIYGDGKNVRDWLYVEDHCDAIYTVLQNGTIGDTYNIGGNNEIQNIQIINTICSIMDELKPRENGEKYSQLITYVKDRPGHDFRYAIDASKIKNDLNWVPKENFETGIKKTIQWYLENEQWWKNIQNNTYQQERLGAVN